jgi:long-chain acyl-CoA synthetase
VYDIERFTIPELVEKSSLRYGKRPALSMVEGVPIRYEELEPRTRRVAALLGLLGAKPGDRVALLSENRPEWGLAYFGISRAGCIAVPIMTDFTGEQIGNILEHSESRVLIVSKRLAPKVGEAAAGRTLVDVEDLSLMQAPGTTASPAAKAAPDGAALAAAAAAFVPPPVKDADLAAIVYTSGTTGHSKGVMLSHRNIVWNAWASRSIIKLNRVDRLLSVLPLAHTYEFTIGFIIPMMQGSAVYYLDRPPSASALLPALAAVRPTIMLSVPLVIEKVYRASVKPALEKIGLYKHGFAKPLLERIAGIKLYKTFGGALRFFGVGGAPLAPDVEAFLRRARFPYAIGYGLTETSPLIAGCNAQHTHMRSTGPALRGVELRIADPRPDTGEGEIQARGPNVMQGYYKEPGKTAEVFSEDGWFRTGDLGTIDEKGRVFVRGRLKTMILGASGENIYPEEIEAVLNRSPQVLESLVYGDETGLTALVHLKPEVLEELAARVQDGIEDAGEAASRLGHAVGHAVGHAGESIAGAERAAAQLLERIKKEANEKLAAFSRIGKVRIQAEPFEKTPKQSIKRFLYPRKNED